MHRAAGDKAGAKLKFMRRRAFSRPRVSRDVRGVLRGETRAMKDSVVRRRANTSGKESGTAKEARDEVWGIYPNLQIRFAPPLVGRTCARSFVSIIVLPNHLCFARDYIMHDYVAT